MAYKNSRPLRVNSWTEWGRLRTIMVGRADNACHYNVNDISSHTKYQINDNYLKEFIDWPSGKVKQTLIDKANQELDNLVKVLESYGVRVLRPTPIDFSREVKTPGWTAAHMHCCVCPRDVLITIGNWAIEATMSERNRFFEFLCYRDVLNQLFEEDKQFKWKSAPKCSMKDHMYRQEFRTKYDKFEEKTEEEKRRLLTDCEYYVNEKEIAFDAASALRLGKDIFVGSDCVTNLKAIEWLTRELEGKVRVHRLNFETKHPHHIDATFLPLRPPRNGRKGVLISSPEQKLFDEHVKIFTDNNWEIHKVPMPNKINYPMPAFCYCSEWLSMNMLSIDENTVVSEENETDLHKFLEGLGFTVVKVPFRNVFMFGGSLHCSTWDIEREDTDEDFFPNQ